MISSRHGWAAGMLWTAAIALSMGSIAGAHEVRPALLQITQTDAHHYDVLWKQPVNGEVAVRLVPRLSSGALDTTPGVASLTPSFAIKIWKNVADEGAPLEGQTVSVDGLERSITDVLINVSLMSGRSVQLFLKPSHSSVRLELNERAAPPASAYFTLGVEHILTGVDHLLFVFGLLLLVRNRRALLGTITAFTLAHSVTLAATTLGWIHVRSAVVEALVALSIVILAVELVRERRNEPGLASRYPWLIAFTFGLLHGCAFAGALSEVGLPQNHIPLALFLFNVGVETGQLLFIAGALVALWAAAAAARTEKVGKAVKFGKALGARVPGELGGGTNMAVPYSHRAAPYVRLAVPYAIGTFATYWFIERFALAINVTG